MNTWNPPVIGTTTVTAPEREQLKSMTNEDIRAIKSAIREVLDEQTRLCVKGQPYEARQLEPKLRELLATKPMCPRCGLELVYEPARASHVASCTYYTPSTKNTSSGHPGSIHKHPWLKHD